MSEVFRESFTMTTFTKPSAIPMQIKMALQALRESPESRSGRVFIDAAVPYTVTVVIEDGGA